MSNDRGVILVKMSREEWGVIDSVLDNATHNVADEPEDAEAYDRLLGIRREGWKQLEGLTSPDRADGDLRPQAVTIGLGADRWSDVRQALHEAAQVETALQRFESAEFLHAIIALLNECTL
jgi:hypothetical protein